MTATDFIYDIETYINMFSCDITHVETGTRWIFEVSDRRDQSRHFFEMLVWIKNTNGRMFGYNNEGFDWPVVQHLMEIFAAQGFFTALDAYDKAQQIIDPRARKAAHVVMSRNGISLLDAYSNVHSGVDLGPEIQSILTDAVDRNHRFANTIWPNERLVPQGDLYKIHHFDNVARATSLKKLEIAMRSNKVVDLPYGPHEPLTFDQMDEVIAYMCHDVRETAKFYHHSLDQIRFRDDLSVRYPDLGDVINFNDTKIGKKYFEAELERASPGSCYSRVNGRRRPNQTIRQTIALADVISPKVNFDSPEFARVLDWLKGQVLERGEIDGMKTEAVETKGVLKDVSATLNGFTFDFGTGGIHGSVKAQTVRSSETHDLIDVDVASYYPNLAIANRWFPRHLSETFCDIYQQVYDMRKSHPKGTAENAMLKLALNGVYGDSNNKYSPFYDPQYTMAITINGQLYLCMLAEWLIQTVPDTSMVQINTDGLTMLVPKRYRNAFEDLCRAWENHTGLELEHADYEAMHIRDVNSYIAVNTTGKRKRIGAYAYQTPHDDPYTRERQWHQDHSALVVRKAAEAALCDNVDVSDFIAAHNDPFDFMLSVKVPRNSSLSLGGQPVQNTTRYYVSTVGGHLIKTMPPLKGKTEPRDFAVQKGWTVTDVNDAANFDWSTLNRLYYIEEAKKLVNF